MDLKRLLLPGSWLRVALAFLGFVVVPLVGASLDLISDFSFFLFSLMAVNSIAVLGLNVLTGYNGQISLGHGAFFALGSYVAAILIGQYGWPYWTTLPAVAIVSFVVGYLFGLPALRLEGHYLALATFALAIAVPQILKYRHFEPFTHGVHGITLTKPDVPFDLPLSQDQWIYLFCAAVAAVLFWGARNLLEGRSGLAIMAIRDHQTVAETMGIDTADYKKTVFGISAMYTGIAGGLGAITISYVAPDSFPFWLSITFLVGMVVGGTASIPGSIVGGIFATMIDKYADDMAKAIGSNLHLPVEIPPWTIYGVALILLIHFLPTGIAGALVKLRERLGPKKTPIEKTPVEKSPPRRDV